jgi:LysM repeat protein
MDRLDELKAKYRPVVQLFEQPGMRLHNLHVADNKLVIRGTAPSDQMKNRVWDQIKQIDAKYSDLAAEITVNPSPAPTGGAQAAQPSAVQTKTYTVQAGDTLSKIAKQFYGNANDYMRIFEANKDQLKDPNMIKVGQVLKIPS